MNAKTSSLTVLVFALLLAVLVLGCRSIESSEDTKAGSVSLQQMSPPARATTERLTANGRIEKIDKEREHGKVVYDVEATVGGKHVEYTIGEADGAVLGTETSVGFGELPQPVRAAAESYFGGTTELKAMKGFEAGKTYYEVEGRKNGKNAEVTFDPSGKRIE